MKEKIVTKLCGLLLVIGSFISACNDQKALAHGEAGLISPVRMETSYQKMPVNFCMPVDEALKSNLQRGKARLEIHITHLQPLSAFTPSLLINAYAPGEQQKKFALGTFSLYFEKSVDAPKTQKFSFAMSDYLSREPNLTSVCFEVQADKSEKNDAIEHDRSVVIQAGFSAPAK